MRAVVTGAGGGLGREFLSQLAAPGVKLIAADIDIDAAERAAIDARESGAEVVVVECDISDATSARALAAVADRAWGGVDLLINNAAIFVAGDILDVPHDMMIRALAINVGGIHLICGEIAPLLRSGSRIINVTSLAGTFELPKAGVYAATKAAATALSEGLRHELAPRGIAVTTVCPSFIRTGFVAAGAGVEIARVEDFSAPMFRWLGADADAVVRSALEASAHGRARDIPALHGRVALFVRRMMPGLTRYAVSAAYRMLAH